MKLRYTPRAADELEAAVDWYEEQLPGLGLDFLDCVEAALGLLLRNPAMYPESHGNFRRCLVRRFPFSLFYTIEHEVVVLHSVFDNRRDPKQLPL